MDKPSGLRPTVVRLIHGFLLIAALNGFLLPSSGFAQRADSTEITNSIPDSLTIDSLVIVPDSTSADSVSADSVQPAPKSFLDTEVKYTARDSIILDAKKQKAYLFGDAHVYYEDLELSADYIEMNFQTSLVYATGLPDSTGKLVGTPIFQEAGTEYRSQEMTYNFESKKGKIKQAFTQEGEGYIHGNAIKKQTDDVFFIRKGRYTTCNLEEPHFHIQANKLKVINNSKIVTGPANLWIEDIPTPLAIPFGFFPNKSERQSGVIIPVYGNSPAQGFFLQNGGYYFGYSDHWDASLLGDIYTNGSYALRALVGYNKRYVHNGNMDVSFSALEEGDPETTDFRRTEQFFVRWSHTQDPKARPNSNFRANVNAGSSNYFQNDLNTSVNDFLSTNFNSNISYTKSFANSPFSLTMNASHNQNSTDSTINLTLPQATLTMSRVFPFKRKVSIGEERFYEKIGISLTSQFRNTVTTKEDEFFSESTLDLMRNGVQHDIPITTSVKVAKHFTFSPTINWSENWYFQTIRKSYDEGDTATVPSVVNDTVGGFERFGQVTMGTGLATNLYGMYTFKRGRVQAVRHKVTPSVRIDYTPNLYAGNRHIFREVQSDSNGNIQEYTIFDEGIFGAPTTYERAIVSFDLQNTLEMKYRPRSDTAEALKKATLLEMLQFSSAYDIFRDSLNWSELQIGMRTSVGKFLNVRTDFTLDPYTNDDNGRRINTFELEKGRLFRLTRASTALGFNLRSKEQKEEAQKPGEEEEDVPILANVADEDLAYVLANRNRYVDFNVPWSLNINYNITYTNNGVEEQIVNSLGLNGDVNVTKNWKVRASTNYDFENNQLGITSIDVFRDLHCWEIVFSTIPFGSRTFYSFDIHVKASVLQDLKLTRRRSWFDLN